ncbi:MAG TPA: hypothetical protein PLV41_01305 [Miltoncostaeales bacterium]|jgi:hypothetical protein|nr:hypothetical protein [Miltoncostaeales bacterium]
MSRIHAFLIALLVTGAVAVGAATAFTVAGEPAKPGTALNSAVLQQRADAINAAEVKLAKALKATPKPDRTPITKVITVPVSGGGSVDDSGNHSGSPASAPSTSRHDDDDDDYGDDHDDDHGDDDDDDHGDDHGSDD